MTPPPSEVQLLCERLREAQRQLELAQADWAYLVDAPTLQAGQQRTIDVLRDAADLLTRLSEQREQIELWLESARVFPDQPLTTEGHLFAQAEVRRIVRGETIKG